MNDLDVLLADHQEFHSDLQMDCFITARSGGTTYGMYKQALRELVSRRRALLEDYLRLQELRLDIEELEDITATTTRAFRRSELELARKTAEAQDLERAMNDRAREFGRFLSQARVLKAQLGDLSDERRAMLEAELWQHRLKMRAGLELLTLGRLEANTIELVGSLPADVRRPLTEAIASRGELMTWVQSYEPPSPIVDAPTLTAEVVRKELACL